MARQIKVDSGRIRELVTKFAEFLTKTKLTDGKVKFNADLGKIERKAKLTFAGIAWLKMQYLISSFTTECGWYGLVERSQDEEDEYYVKDIVVYPQSVTGSTVSIDEAELAKWQMTQEDDVINHLRMHGHSHVNMGVTPSSTDEEHYDNILSTLGSEDFYVFCIYNKQGAHTVRIYDYAKNVFFENADVEVLVDTEDGLFDWMEGIDELVKTKTWTQSSYYGGKTAGSVSVEAASAAVSTPTKIQDGARIVWDDDDDDWRDYDAYCGYYGRGYKK